MCYEKLNDLYCSWCGLDITDGVEELIIDDVFSEDYDPEKHDEVYYSCSCGAYLTIEIIPKRVYTGLITETKEPLIVPPGDYD